MRKQSAKSLETSVTIDYNAVDSDMQILSGFEKGDSNV